MTVSTTTNSVTYTGNGTTTAFPVPYQFLLSTDLVVTERVIATGAETVKTLTTHYTVAGGGGATGTVNAVSAPASTVTWTITRNTAKTQATDYTDNDPFPAETHERGLDRVTMIAQDAAGETARAIKVPASDSSAISTTIPASAARADKILGFDSTGAPTAIGLGELGGETIITPVSVVNGGTGQNSAAGARTNLGLAIGSDVQAYHALLADIAGLTLAEGDILHFDGANIVNLGAGTSGYFLKTQGAGNPPVWGTLAGSWELIQTYSPSGVAAQAITAFDATKYDDYELRFDHLIPSSDGATIRLLTSTDGGSNYDSGGSDYAYIGNGHLQGTGAISTGDDAAGFIDLTVGQGVDAAAGTGLSGSVFLINTGATARCAIRWHVGFRVGAGNICFIAGYGERVAGANVDAVQVLPSTANITGTIKFLGRRI